MEEGRQVVLLSPLNESCQLEACDGLKKYLTSLPEHCHCVDAAALLINENTCLGFGLPSLLKHCSKTFFM